MVKFIKIGPVVFLLVAIVCAVGYQVTGTGIFLTMAITFGTTAYHFIMRWMVAFIYNFFMDNHADYRKPWYQVGQWEMKLYEKLQVKRWKNHMPTYTPACLIPESAPGIRSPRQRARRSWGMRPLQC